MVTRIWATPPAVRSDTTHFSLVLPRRRCACLCSSRDRRLHLHQTTAPIFVRNAAPAAALLSLTLLFGPNLTHPLFNAVIDTFSLSSTSPRHLHFSVSSEMLPKNLFSLTRRGLHSKTRTFYSPTPDFLHEYLSHDSLPGGSVSVFMLSTSLPNLPGHLSVLQAAFPTSIGSFSVSSPGSEPTVSLATFWGTDIKVFKSDLTGRAPAEVGRFQRPERQRNVPPEDRRGSTSRDVEAAFGQGWENLWNGEVENKRIAELEGVQADTFLLLSDSRPAPVLKALDSMFPKAIKVGS